MSEVVEAPKERTRRATRSEGGRPATGLGRLADAGLVVALLALTFLLGAFPLKDTDFWWHLRTGDLIRQTGEVPRVDTYTFGAEGHRWVDLHWVFQILLSIGYERIGVAGLTLAKCAVTCLALWLLVSAKRRDWPTWVMVLAWLPALLVLAGRMYIRPETLTLLYLAAFLAILFRWDERPWLAFLLPVVQLAWVNSQGLFVLGPILLNFALIDASLRRGAFAAERRGWWRTILIASGLTGLVCLVNPYGIAGALYPLQLASTMGNKVFETIGELKPLPTFIQEAGWTNGPLLIHLTTIFVGVMSFLVPIAWRVADRLVRARDPEFAKAPPKKRKARSRKKAETAPDAYARPSLFRLLLFVAFTLLSMKATRNSHQFAAVVGTITAWNFGEWAAEVARRRTERGRAGSTGFGRAAAFAATAALFVATASGALYAWEGEGRTVGLGEEPHWFPHEAVAFAGRPDMPRRSLCFHNGHAALYEYAYAPDRKTYADARLEVIGPKVYTEYMGLQARIGRNTPGWEDELEAMGRPLVLTDNIQAMMSDIMASLLTSKRYRCVWFDPVAALFVHEGYAGAASSHAFDFGDRHFRRDDRPDPTDATAERMQAKTCWNVIHNLTPPAGSPRPGGAELSRKLVRAGLDHARAVQRLDPGSGDGWKWAGMIELYRDPLGGDPIPRFKMPFEPVFDLSSVRASADLRRALERSPKDANVRTSLFSIDYQRGMYAPAFETLDGLLALRPSQSHERQAQDRARSLRPEVIARLGRPPVSLAWANLSELHRHLGDLYDHGRVAEAADLLESAYPADGRPWEIWDRVATIRLHLGEPERAARLWADAKNPPSEALRQARIAAARLAGGDFDAARTAFRAAIAADPKLFEAYYGLAVLEADAGHAREALAAAKAAAETAPSGTAKSAAQQIVGDVTPFANP